MGAVAGECVESTRHALGLPRVCEEAVRIRLDDPSGELLLGSSFDDTEHVGIEADDGCHVRLERDARHVLELLGEVDVVLRVLELIRELKPIGLGARDDTARHVLRLKRE